MRSLSFLVFPWHGVAMASSFSLQTINFRERYHRIIESAWKARDPWAVLNYVSHTITVIVKEKKILVLIPSPIFFPCFDWICIYTHTYFNIHKIF